MTPPDRRSETRYQKHLSLQLFDEKRDPVIDPIMMDLSLNGLCFETAKPPAIGASLSFRVHIPKHGYVAGVGKVRWTYAGRNMKHLCGVQFETFGWANKQALKAYLMPHSVGRRPLEDVD